MLLLLFVLLLWFFSWKFAIVFWAEILFLLPPAEIGADNITPAKTPVPPVLVPVRGAHVGIEGTRPTPKGVTTLPMLAVETVTAAVAVAGDERGTLYMRLEVVAVVVIEKPKVVVGWMAVVVVLLLFLKNTIFEQMLLSILRGTAVFDEFFVTGDNDGMSLLFATILLLLFLLLFVFGTHESGKSHGPSLK